MGVRERGLAATFPQPLSPPPFAQLKRCALTVFEATAKHQLLYNIVLEVSSKPEKVVFAELKGSQIDFGGSKNAQPDVEKRLQTCSVRLWLGVNALVVGRVRNLGAHPRPWWR